MADKKISQLTTATTPLAGSEVLPIVQSSSTVKVSVDNLTAGKSVSAANFVATSATVPANGMFLGATNTLSFSTNSAEHWRIDATGALTPKGTETIGSFYTSPVTHIYAKQFSASKTTGTDQVRVTTGDAAGSLASPINIDVTFVGYGGENRARIRAVDTSSNTYASGLTFSNNNGSSLVESFQITTASDVKALLGNVVIGTAGKGIDFSVNTHAAGMTSELLNDYEEGTFTPALAVASGSLTYSVQGTPLYTKIGRLVNAVGYINVSVVNVPSGALTITGLPYAAATFAAVNLTLFTGGFTTAYSGYVSSAGTTVVIPNLNSSIMVGGENIMFAATYPTT